MPPREFARGLVVNYSAMHKASGVQHCPKYKADCLAIQSKNPPPRTVQRHPHPQDAAKLRWPFKVVDQGDGGAAMQITVAGEPRIVTPEECGAGVLSYLKKVRGDPSCS